MSTIAQVGTVITLDDVLAEGTDGQYLEVTFTTAAGTPIDTAAIVSIAATLRSVDTGGLVNAVQALDVTPGAPSGRGSYPGAPGVFRYTCTAADMAAVGSRERQSRALTLAVTHSTDQRVMGEVRFQLVNLADVVSP